MRWPLSRMRSELRARSRFSCFALASCCACCSLSRAFCASAWRFWYSCSGLPFFAALLLASAGVGGAGRCARALIAVVLTPGGGVSPHARLPSFVVQHWTCAWLAPARSAKKAGAGIAALRLGLHLLHTH